MIRVVRLTQNNVDKTFFSSFTDVVQLNSKTELYHIVSGKTFYIKAGHYPTELAIANLTLGADETVITSLLENSTLSFAQLKEEGFVE